MTSPHLSPDLSSIDRSARATWLLFTDWSSACAVTALPASPESVAAFLADHPAKVSTHRRRVATINAVHRHCGLPEPGRAHAVHRALATRRAERLRILEELFAARIAALPTTGWPHGLFGRRDALILSLAAAGLTYTEIAALRRGDVRVDATNELVIDGQRQWRLDAGSPARGPVAVYTRWAQVQAMLDGFPSTRLLAHSFTGARTGRSPARPSALTAKAAAQPLIVTIDRWGHIPLVPAPTTAQSIAAITSAHLQDRAPTHQRKATAPPPEDVTESAAAADAPILLDETYYDRGVEARLRARDALDTVGDVLDEVSLRAERLLQDLAAIVGEPATAENADVQ